jgi:signal transduction histidine kinase
VFSVAVAGLLAYLFSRAIGSRFAHVTDNAARLARSEPLAPPLGGIDEIAGLDRVLQDTAARLGAAAAAAEQARRELETRLDEVGQLNLELRQTTEENETFIYSVSHDLRSPLVNLQGFSKELTMTCAQLQGLLDSNALPPALREQARKLVEGDIAESLGFIKTAVSRASLIIDSLLRLSRAGRVEYRWQYVAVSRIVKNVVDAMRITIGERKAEVVVRELDDAWGDATALEQVFANVIGNAVMYLDPNRPGRVEIGMEPTPAAIARVSSQPPSRTYYIRDNGLGLPAAAIGKLFTAFHRHHSGQAPGEGVGLALVRRIVERHHGRIWVNSQEGVGSTFYVELPAEPAVTAAAPPDSASQGRPDLAPASS